VADAAAARTLPKVMEPIRGIARIGAIARNAVLTSTLLA
jgi:hypothetical protein